MSDEKSKSDQHSAEKRRKLDVCEDQHENLNTNRSQKQDEEAEAGPLNVQPELLASLDGINVDCLEELFEWLPVSDLLHLRQMCKRLKRTIEYHIKTNLPTIGRFRLNEDNLKMFHGMDDSSIGLIKELDVTVGPDFCANKFETIRNVLNKVKTIYILNCQLQRNMEEHFYDVFLKYCESVKDLSIACNSIINSDMNWLNHRYPNLERVGFLGKQHGNHIRNLKTFFIQNPQIHTVTFSSSILNKYALSLSCVDIKFEQLNIGDLFSNHIELGAILFELLKQLYARGFYKKLHLYVYAYGMTEVDAERLVLPGLEKLLVQYANFTFPSIPSLKELSIEECNDPNDIENLKNIERFLVYRLNPECLMCLIEEYPKLKIIKIDKYAGDKLDLVALNKQREKLSGACKITIYVDEVAYFATKWSTTKTDLRFIELKRVQSYDCEKIY